MRRALLPAVLLLAVPLRAQAGDQAAVLGVAAETDSVTVGEPFRAGVLLRAPPGATLDLVLREPVPPAVELVEAARAHPADPPATHRAVATLVLWVVDPPATVPAEARVLLPDGSVRAFDVELPLPPVRALLPADSAAPRGPKDIVPLASASRFPWGWIAIGGALLVLLLAALAWRRRSGRETVDEPDARRRALAELEGLRTAGLLEAGEVDEFYARLSRIVRDFAAPRVGVDRTTAETVELLRRAGAPSAGVDALARVLGSADLAKFARRPPSPDEARADWEAARTWVEGFDRTEAAA